MKSKLEQIKKLFEIKERIEQKIVAIDKMALVNYELERLNESDADINRRKWKPVDEALEKGLIAIESGEWKPKHRKLIEVEEEEESWEEAIQKAHKRAHEIGFIETSSDLIDNIEQALKEMYNPPVIKKNKIN